MILDPITIIGRTIISSILPALNLAVTAAETALYPHWPTAGPARRLREGCARPSPGADSAILPAQRAAGAGFVGILALNWMAPRFWCRYLCPLGALLALPARVAFWRPRTAGGCTSLRRLRPRVPHRRHHAARAALTLTLRECVMCMDCQVECPQQSIAFWRARLPRAAAHPTIRRDARRCWRWAPAWRASPCCARSRRPGATAHGCCARPARARRTS